MNIHRSKNLFWDFRHNPQLILSLLDALGPASSVFASIPADTELFDLHRNTSSSWPHTKHLEASDACLGLKSSVFRLPISNSQDAVGFER
jgi:hypothetical protein